MARRTKLGDLDMRFKSSHRIIARRNFFGCLGSGLSVPFILIWKLIILIWNLIRTVAVKAYTQIHNSVTWYSSSIKLLRRELGPKNFRLCLKVILVSSFILSFVFITILALISLVVYSP